MKKVDIAMILLEELERKYQVLAHSALDAKEAATNEESKPENKYDTRALEASYLASAQSSRVEELRRAISRLSQLELVSFASGDAIRVGALVQLEATDTGKRWVFILPYGGGERIRFENTEILVLTPEAPLGKALLGKRESDEFEFRVQKKLIDYEVLKVL